MTRQVKGSKCDWQFVCRGGGGRDEMKTEVQVAIVGGGAMGVGLLYHLAHEGWTDTVLLGAVTRTIRGIEVDSDSLAIEVIDEVVKGAGHFLGHEQTLRVMQTEYMYPAVGDRLSPEDWADGDSLNVRARASRRVAEIPALPPPAHITSTADVLIRDRFPIHLDLA
jgi:trimethylamine:corrinoid methyltransferase-like protein